jgi:predicted DNA-binding transcriptional regulator AlpA
VTEQDINVDLLADAIAKKLRLLPPKDKVLWDAKECAEYLRFSQKHFVDHISKTLKFPRPIKLPSEAGRRAHPRWYASEVMDWAKSYKQAS